MKNVEYFISSESAKSAEKVTHLQAVFFISEVFNFEGGIILQKHAEVLYFDNISRNTLRFVCEKGSSMQSIHLYSYIAI